MCPSVKKWAVPFETAHFNFLYVEPDINTSREVVFDYRCGEAPITGLRTQLNISTALWRVIAASPPSR